MIGGFTMKFSISRSHLLAAINKVEKAVTFKTPIPALTGIKFEIIEQQLVLTGSDANMTIQTHIVPSLDNKLEIFKPGAIVLAKKYITEIIRKLDSDIISIELLDGFLTEIRDHHSVFNLNGMNVNEYPFIDLETSDKYFSLNAKDFKQLILQTTFAASKDEASPTLTGIYFTSNDNNMLTAIATDRFRLSRKTLAINENIIFNALIPAKSLDELSKICNDDEVVTVYISHKKVLFKTTDTFIQSRLIEGNYPDVEKLIFDDYTYLLEVNSHELSKAIDRTSLLSSSTSAPIVKMTLSNQENIISSKSQEIGSATETLSHATFKGEPLEISFSYRYVLEAIKAINHQDISILFLGDKKPFLIKNTSDDSIVQLVVPVKTY